MTKKLFFGYKMQKTERYGQRFADCLWRGFAVPEHTGPRDGQSDEACPIRLHHPVSSIMHQASSMILSYEDI